MDKYVKWAVVAAVAAIMVVWIAGETMLPERNPEPRHSGTITTAEGDEVLRRACFDCHSNETIWPVYTHWPVISLLLAIDVGDGREELNYSDWDSLSAEERLKALKHTLEEIREGEMPPATYVWLHAEARLSPEDLALLESAMPAEATAGDSEQDED
jgi:hypothetical protein